VTAGVELDHLVVAARTLDEGAAWCEATFGVAPGAGGRHPLMGTHNRLLPLDARAYLEIIAIDPEAPPTGRVRWFDLDAPAMRQALAAGPRLVHWVARCTAIDAVAERLHAAGAAVGDIVAAERATAAGLLRWRISVRADGRRPAAGALPALIEWQGPHPVEAMGTPQLTLLALDVAGIGEAAWSALAPRGAVRRGDGPPLRAVIDGPGGRVTLDAPI
jgi:hypothetical protein